MAASRNNDVPNAPPAPLAAAGDTRSLRSRKRSRDEAESTAATGGAGGSSIESRIPARRSAFNRDLSDFLSTRGITPELKPVAGKRGIDLYILLKKVCAAGGYDSLSNPRSGASHWRDLCGQLGLPEHLSFQVKTIYQKYLAAYEIARLHQRAPPAKELLEDVPAVGGGLLSRTVEEYQALVNSRVDTLGRLLRQFFPAEAGDTLKRFFNLEAEASQEEEPQAEEEAPLPGGNLSPPLLPQHPDQYYLTHFTGNATSDQTSAIHNTLDPRLLDPRLFAPFTPHPETINPSDQILASGDTIDSYLLTSYAHYPEPTDLTDTTTSKWFEEQKEQNSNSN
ncbi:hypothetical protein VTN00DRAFT_4957 [Thermoascus crustaceus]|uniref:uncharacterized protein n=1 Tax=Thermoascus crustaceus TaxID=5088 RepID=UPI0037444BC9